jgi:sugar-specific transcriptional regulator TrmB
MIYSDSRKGEVHNGFKCIGHTRDGLWGQFRLDNSQEWSEQQRQDWQRENQRRKQQQASENEQRRKRSLAATERHEEYARLLSELTLHPDDRADLVRRGFTHEQIELSGFKSIGRYQQLQSQYSELLPGISRGNRLIIADEGYLCPIRNVDGLVTACQVRLRTLPTAETSRYRWLSGGGQTLHLYPEGCKDEGELPLPVFRPQGKPEGIALAEGTGAKPFLVSQRLNLLTIGAAGGQWASSLELFRSTLEKVALEIKGRSIKIFPDAGDILNQSVMSRWQRVISLLEEWGWEVAIGWWGQANKSDLDIDELDIEELIDHNTIEYISSTEFLDLSKIKPTEQDKRFSQYQEKAKEAWHRAKRFVADIQRSSEWCDWKLPPQNSIFFGRAGLGRGKTTRLRNWVRTWQEEGKGFICLGYRNTLLLQLCEKLGFYHLHESDSALMRHDPSGGIALCVDSLWRLRPEEFDGKILILDEVMSVIKHLLHSPTVKGRDNILELFQEALQRASQVICLDGCMADWAVKYLHELAPGKKIIRAENTFQGEKPTVNFLVGTVDIEEEVKKNDRSPWLDYLLNHCVVPAVCSDSQVFIESLDNLLTERGAKTLRIDSKTVPEEYVKEFLKDCNAYIKKHQPDVILYTPSAESGVDVSIGDYFTGHIGFFFGVLGVDSILQMLGRIRDAKCTKFVWIREWVAQSEQTHSRSPFVKKVGQAIEKMLCADIADTVSGIDRDQDIISKLWAIIQGSKNPHFEASNQIQAITNYEKSNLRECVLESLKASGYPIRMCTLNPSEDAKERVKEATEETKRRNCRDIFTAEKIDPESADEVSKKFDARWEDRVKVIQASYRSRLPGIDETPSWTEDFIYKIRYDHPDFISQQELFWMYSHPEEANRMNQERYHRIAQKERTFIGNIRSRMARVRALRAINFERFLDPEKTWMEDSPELVQLVEQCRDEKITAALGRHPGKQSNIRFLGSLLKMIGLKHKGQKVKSEDGDYRIYHLDRDTLSDPDRRNALQCLDRRWENYLKKEVEVLDWEPILNPIAESQQAEINENSQCQQEGDNSQQAKSPQFQSGQGFDPVPRTPTEYIYINEASWNQIDPVESQGVGQPLEGVAIESDPIAELVEALPYCDTLQTFAAVVSGYLPETVEDAIALQDSQHRRSELQRCWEIVTDARFLQSVTHWHQATLSQDRLNEAWRLLDVTEQNRLHALCQAEMEPVERQWGISRKQAEMGGTFEWVRGGLVRIGYAASDFVKLATGDFVPYSELRALG